MCSKIGGASCCQDSWLSNENDDIGHLCGERANDDWVRETELGDFYLIIPVSKLRSDWYPTVSAIIIRYKYILQFAHTLAQLLYYV
jgi:hypothetical protein